MPVYDIRPAQPSDFNGIPEFQRAAIASVPKGVYAAPAQAARIGRRIVLTGEDAITTKGYIRLFVPASLNATGFYERLGYRSDGDAESTQAEQGSRSVECGKTQHGHPG